MSAPLRILLIEDDLVDQMAFTAHVKKEQLPYEVQIAKSIAEARHLLKSCVFDLVIADYHLSDGTTFELFDILESKLVIFATGAGDEEIAMRALRLGVRDYMIKDPERNYLKLLSHRVDSALHQWRSEAALRESEARYRDLFETANDLIQSAAPDGTILFVNRAWREALGYTEDEVKGLKLQNLIHPSALAGCMEKFHLIMGGQTLTNIETTFLTKDGREILLEGSASCHFEGGKPVSTRGIFHDVTARKRAEAAVKAALKEKEVLLQEIHHRVKNNLQVVCSLLNLQARNYNDPGLRAAFDESQQRIRSMALIHEMLYQSKDLAEIDFDEYLRALVPALMRGYGLNGGRVGCNIDAETMAVRPETAVPLALIVNELVTNSLKHGFPEGRTGRISVACHRCKPGSSVIDLTVRDDGVGLPPDFSIGKSNSLGLRLVGMMAKQLAAQTETRSENGAVFVLTFRLPDRPPQL